MSIIDQLARHANSNPTDIAFTYIESCGAATKLSFAELYHATQKISLFLHRQVQPGDTVVLLFPQGLDYIKAFLGCLHAGVIAVPLYPPTNTQHTDRVHSVIKDCHAALALTSHELKPTLLESLQPLKVCTLADGMSYEISNQKCDAKIEQSQLAFLQYTSGSTGNPKGVMVSHSNIIANLKSLESATLCHREDVFCNWLPLFHDLGLVNTLLLPIYLGAHSVLMSPSRFMKRPVAWLEAISQYRASICGAPNFAFELCTNRITAQQLTNIDLSCWRVAFNAAEPIKLQTLVEFQQKFAVHGFQDNAFYPSYGMAEATVFISGGQPDKPFITHSFSADKIQQGEAYSASTDSKTLKLVACGRVQESHNIKIVSPESLQEVAEEQIGEIWFSGPSVAQGYWNAAEKTAESFNQSLSHDSGHFLRTGDLGFIHAGELYICGRIKDVLIIKGRNYYPQDIEQSAFASCDGLRASGIVAFEQQDGVVLIAEVDTRALKSFNYQWAAQNIAANIFASFDILLQDIVFIRAGKLSKTSSGKVQRQRTKQSYLNHEFSPLFSLSEITTSTQYEAPQGSMEIYLASLWQPLLQNRIGRHDNFFQLGGQSMAAASLITKINQTYQLDLSLSVLFECQDLKSLAAYLTNAIAEQDTCVNMPSRITLNNKPIVTANQKSLWLLDQMDTGSPHYNIFSMFEITGDLNIIALQAALNTLIQRYAILRTTYHSVSDSVEACVQSEFTFKLLQRQVSNESEVIERAYQQQKQVFNLSKDLMLRAELLCLKPQHYRLLLCFHHIAVDGISLQILEQELSTLYHGYQNDQTPTIGQHAFQFSDYAANAMQSLSANRTACTNYWLQSLKDLPACHNLPLDKPRPSKLTFRGGSVNAQINPQLLASLKLLARTQKTTLYTVLQTAFACLIHRYTAHNEVVMGSPYANRELPETNQMIGYLVNPLVLRNNFADNVPFNEQLQYHKQIIEKALKHHHLPFVELVDLLKPERSLAYHPLFQILFTFNQASEQSLNLAKCDVKAIPCERLYARFDIALEVTEQTDGLSLVWEYARDIFNEKTINRLNIHFQQLLTSIVKSPERPISQQILLTQSEQHYLLRAGVNQLEAPKKWQSVVDCFVAQVNQTPNKKALFFKQQSITFSDLNKQANQLAYRLIDNGAQKGRCVAICMERSIDTLVGLWAILKSGAAYVPLDPGYPLERLNYMLQDSAACILLCQTDTLDMLDIPASCLQLDFDVLTKPPFNTQLVDLPTACEQDLAYIIYTSGSTGKPKGVQINHANLINFFVGLEQKFGRPTKQYSHWLAVTSICFDISVLELFWTSCRGDCVTIQPERPIAQSGQSITKQDKQQQQLLNKRLNHVWQAEVLVKQNNITHLQCTPSFAKQLSTETLQHLSVLLVGGEALSNDLANQLTQSASLKVFNMYGPTEATVWVSINQVKHGQKVYLAGPMANTQFVVLNKHYQLVPEGVVGELYIAGDSVSTGYWQRKKLTEERFIANPFKTQAGYKNLYKTGDLVCWMKDEQGQLVLDYQGRADQQVKVNGFRIELSEVETVLKALEHIKDAVVAVKESGNSQQLVAYLIMDDQPQTDIFVQYRQRLAEKLPEYMLPARFVVLAEFPLTANGKLDRNALPEPDVSESLTGYVAPSSELEQQLCDIWQRILGLQQIGVDDNFFAIGGHSLLATKLIAEVNLQFKSNFSLQLIFTAQTIKGLAKQIEKHCLLNSLKANDSAQGIAEDDLEITI
ncbi:non-ribosomal peptide synthetase [Catenovulum sediminis]|uniref:non-ribosomal peptide synthetase n=1 Tax=Catenovulum sediminis TaxID=1740262 RepID=UPI001180BCF9|nr:non-ribosomal peptide synthetase [Catenovulum sediminis]